MRPLDSSLAPGRQGPSAAGRSRRGRRRRPDPAVERRGERRFPVANTEIRNHAATGHVLDLTRNGMAIESFAALRPGQRYTFTLTIGEHVETLVARVLWCRLRTTRRLPNGDVLPVYRAGIERVRPPKAERVPEPASGSEPGRGAT